MPGQQGVGHIVDFAHGLGHLDIAAFVERVEGNGKSAEGLAPQLVYAFLAAAVEHQPAEGEGFLQAATAFPHQVVAGGDFHADRLQIDQTGKNVGGAVEHGTGIHGALDPFLARIGLFLIGFFGFGQAMAGDVETMLGVIEQASGQRLNQAAFGMEGIFRHRVGLDPVTVRIDAFAPVNDAQGAVGNVLIHILENLVRGLWSFQPPMLSGARAHGKNHR